MKKISAISLLQYVMPELTVEITGGKACITRIGFAMSCKKNRVIEMRYLIMSV